MKRILIGLALLVALAIGFGPQLAPLSGQVVAQTTTFGVPSSSGTQYQFLQYQDNAGNVKGTSSVSAAALTLNNTSEITRISHFSMSVTPSSVAAQSCSDQSVTISSLTSNDVLLVNPGIMSTTQYTGTASFVAARVSTSGIAAFRYCNPTSASQTPSAATFTGFVIRKS